MNNFEKLQTLVWLLEIILHGLEVSQTYSRQHRIDCDLALTITTIREQLKIFRKQLIEINEDVQP
jgi:hypothetical protein